MFLSTQLVTDMQELKFGWQGCSAFESCQRGISPVSVPHSSIKVHQQLRAMEEDAEQASTTTLADVRATRTDPPPCPTDYFGSLQMLCACVKLLMMMFGWSCEHAVNMTTICYLVKEKMAMFERADRNQMAHLLWAIFTDTQACFNMPHDVMGNPPVSSLDWLIVGAMKGGNLPATLSTLLQSIHKEAHPQATDRRKNRGVVKGPNPSTQTHRQGSKLPRPL
jgi:hypothetical protein